MEADQTQIPRLVPQEHFPPYSYVTGHFPHPIRDSAGHQFGMALETCPAPDPSRWRDCQPYLRGLDLFNHGYYWEAHEVWEGIWHACGRSGLAGNFIKGLIKLAAAGVKSREGRPEGVRSHGHRAAELFQQTGQQLPIGETDYFGLSLDQLIAWAKQIELDPPTPVRLVVPAVEIVFPFVLRPS